jgi:hypothetical protein
MPLDRGTVILTLDDFGDLKISMPLDHGTVKLKLDDF